jgi:predicted type IV restriction endonuclease
MAISAKVGARTTAQLKKYQETLKDAQQRAFNESDTVGVVTGILSDVLGYDKFKEVSSEHPIRGTFADLIVAVDGKKRFLIEVKSITTELKETHVKQAIDYAANDGVPWAVLSNGIVWRLYHVKFGKPIDKLLVFEIDILECDCKCEDVINCFGSLSSEHYSKDVLSDLLSEKQTGSKFTVAAFLRSDAMVASLRKEIRRLSGLRFEREYLLTLLETEIINRELIDSDNANNSVSYVRKLQKAFDKEHPEAADDIATATAPTPAPTVAGQIAQT